MRYFSVEEAIHAPGLRLVLTAGVPGPWGEAAKAIFAFKRIAYTPILQQGGGDNDALQKWTGQTSAPVAVYEDFPPVCHWFDLLMLAERLSRERRLVPEDCSARIDVLGVSALIAGADGFGWQRRLQILAPMLLLDEPPDIAVRLGLKYGWSKQTYASAIDRLQAISAELDDRMLRQQDIGSDFMVGHTVTAADFYWANFAGMLKPLGPNDNPMPDYMRTAYTAVDEATRDCLTPRLEAHRDRMYQEFISLPLDFLQE